MTDTSNGNQPTQPTQPTPTLRENLRQLSEAVGVTGGESEVRKLILGMIKDYVEDIVIDPLGSITARRKGTGTGANAGLRVMLSAHMDEPGLMVERVNEDGLLSLMTVGNVISRYMPARRVLVGPQKLPGVCLWHPIHVSHGENDIVGASKHLVDVGADSKDALSGKVKPGDRVAFMTDYAELSPQVTRGKAFSSRAACATLIELLRGDPFPFDLYAAFPVQEGISGRGSLTTTHHIDPQAAFVLRGADCNDLPAADPDDRDWDSAPVVRMGGGPAITVADSSFVADRRLLGLLLETARAQGIPHQTEAQSNAYTSGGTIFMARAGTPVAGVSVPVRYMGSPNELINISDLENTVRLMRAALSALSPELLA